MQKQIEYTLVKFFRFIILMLPLKSVQIFGKTLGQLSYFLLTKRRAITMENLKYAFPEKEDAELKKITKGVFLNLGISICEFLWFPNLNDVILTKLVNFKNLDLMIEGNKRGKGMIMLSGHFGNWEMAALATAYFINKPFTLVVKTQSNLKVDEIVSQHRMKFGNIPVRMEVSVREVLTTLKDGGTVTILADQSAPKESIFVEFFGRSVATFQGPAVFALRTGAPIQMVLLFRKPDMTYEGIIEELDYSDISEYNEQNVFELTQRHVAILEKYIRMYPDQWMWTHRRWKNIK
jgi:KDO2-lipid IV(A) lauroyltransferase